ALAIAVCCAYPLLNHAAAVQGEPRWAVLGLALVAWALAAGWTGALAAIVIAVVAFGLALALAARVPELLLYAPPIAVNLALCVFFARTLRRGHEPLVSRFARIGRAGQLAPDLVRYTRNLTRAWVA